MKTVVLCGITLLMAAPALPQTASAAGAAPNKTVTLTGCVVGGRDAKPITLSQAMIVPADASPVPSSASTDPTEPPPDAATPPPMPSPVGTSGSKSTASTATGTSGIVTGTAPAGSSGSSLSGYRLSGADMQAWIGRRVKVIGAFVPAAIAAPSSATAAGTGAAAAAPVLEFKVQEVQPAPGPCPK